MPLSKTKFLKFDVLYLIVACVLVGLYVLTAGSGFPLDDSWIHQTYARNLAQNGEWAFVSGEPSAASTSPLYTVVLSIGYLLNMPYALWAHLLGAGSLAVMAMLAGRMVAWIFPNSQLVSLTGGILMLTTWHLIWAAASGMETAIFCMLTVVLMYLAWREHYVKSEQSLMIRAVIFGVFSALATLARPEAIMLVGLIGLIFLIVQPQGDLRRVIIYGVVAVVAFVIVMSPYLALNLNLTGGLLPNTANAKFQQHEILLQLPFLTRVQSLIIPILAGGQFLLIPGILIFLWMIVKRESARHGLILLLPLIWAFGLIFLYAGRLPAPYQHGRYVIPALPAIVLVGNAGVLYAVRMWKYQMLPRVVSRALLASALVGQVVFTVILAPPIYATDVSIINEEMVASAQWIDENIPKDELLAIHDIGAVGYFTPRSMLDIAGLVSPDVAPIVDDADALWQLMQDRDAKYLMAFPDQIPGDDVNDPRLCRVFMTGGKTAPKQGGANMAIYRLAWDEDCLTTD